MTPEFHCRQARESRRLQGPAALLATTERSKGIVKMATTELPIKVEKDDTPQTFSKNFDQYGNSSGFIFDVTLSTAIAADGETKRKLKGPRGRSRLRWWTK
jgi:hypothetical protein